MHRIIRIDAWNIHEGDVIVADEFLMDALRERRPKLVWLGWGR